MLWIIAFFLVCFGAAGIKPEGKSRTALTTGSLIRGSILCGLALVLSIIDVTRDGGYASWMMLGIIVTMTSLALIFRIRAMLKKP